MLFLLLFSVKALSAQTAIPPTMARELNSTRAFMQRLDSLYADRDTTGLASALKEWKGSDILRIRLYRGLTEAWTGRATPAIRDLQPLLDSSASRLTQPQRREVLRALSESYARTRKYSQAGTLYDAELAVLDAKVDSLERLDSIAAATPRAPIIQALTSPEPSSPPTAEKIPDQLIFIGLLFALFLIPKMLQRFRIPGAITALLMGAAASALGLFPEDPTLTLLSTLGITALFLFAGLEIDAEELRENMKPLILHATIWTAVAVIVAIGAFYLIDASLRMAALVSLAIVTPSTGFILSTLSTFGLNKPEQRSVRIYAVGSELIALAALFLVLQSTSASRLLLALLAMAGVVVIIPLAFRLFSAVVAPYAPRSEFAFLLMVAVVCAYATRLLGVYYLVGAFLVGVAAQRFRGRHPAMSSEKMVDALESFGSVFIPFYFFHAGTEIAGERITFITVGLGLLLVAVFVPVRVALISLHRKLALGEQFVTSRRIGAAMVPTLVFTLVIVGILERSYGLSGDVAMALIIYTVVNTTIPAFLLRSSPADFEDVEALPIEGMASEG